MARRGLRIDWEVELMWKIRDILKKYKHDIIGNAIYDILRFIAWLIAIPLLSGVVSFNIVPIIIDNRTLEIVVISSVVILAIFAFLAVYWKVRKYKFIIEAQIVKMEYNYNQIIVYSDFVVTALRKNLGSFYDSYSWFEDEKSNIRCETKGFRIKRLTKRNVKYEYVIDFGRTLKKRETVSFRTKITATNVNKHFKNFFTQEIICPTKSLEIQICIPDRFKPKKITHTAFFGSERSTIFTEEKEFYSADSWTIKNPKLGYKYKSSW